MSFLQSIKGTLQSVQQDISTGLKSLTTADRPDDKPSVKPVLTRTVNYDAGAELLQRYQTVWKELYQFSEESGQKAEVVDAAIGKLYVYYDRQEEHLTHFHQASANLPVLLTQLQDITDSLASVEEACDKVEAALVYLEDICEEQELLRNIAAHHKQLHAYSVKKSHELEAYRVKLAQEHAKKVEEVNKKRQHLLKERQDAFQDQFAQDLDYYKKYGKPGRLPSTPESEKKLDLADVEIEEDEAALDDFLGPSSSDLTVTEPTEDVFSEEGTVPEIASEVTSPDEDYDTSDNATSPGEETVLPVSSTNTVDSADDQRTSPVSEGDQEQTGPDDSKEHSTEEITGDQSEETKESEPT